MKNAFQIQQQLEQLAGKIPGYNSRQPNPSVRYLVQAIGQIAQQLFLKDKEADKRILEQLYRVFPENEHSITPAMAILKVNPEIPELTLSSQHHFYCNNQKGEQFYFTPAGDFRLINAKIRYIATGETLTEWQDNNICLNTFFATNALPKQEVWLGLEVDEAIVYLKDWILYLDDKTQIKDFDFLKYCQLSIGEYSLKFEQGFKAVEEELSTFFDQNKRLEEATRRTVEERFILLKEIRENPEISSLLQLCPKAIVKYFPNLTEMFKKHLLWIKMTLPSTFNQAEILKNIRFYLNVIPIINRKKEERFFENSEGINNLFAINPNEEQTRSRSFLFPANIQDNEGRYLLPHYFPFGDEVNINGTYILRKGGIHQMDNQRIKTLSDQLLFALHEKTTWAAVNEKEDIQKLLYQLAERLQDVDTTETEYYLEIHPKINPRQLHVEYWTTDSPFDERLLAGTRLISEEENLAIKSESLILIDHSTRGDMISTLNEKKYHLRAAYLNRSLIPTRAGIKAICQMIAGSMFCDLGIEMDYSHMNPEALAITPKVKIILHLAEKTTFTDRDKLEATRQIQYQLKNQLVSNYAFDIVWQKKHSISAADIDLNGYYQLPSFPLDDDNYENRSEHRMASAFFG